MRNRCSRFVTQAVGLGRGGSSSIMDAGVRLASDPDAPRLARRHVVEIARGAPRALVSDALLLVSELVTNAVKHGGSAFVTLYASASPRLVRIAVHDGGEGLPAVVAEAPDRGAPGGRGLMIVSALASRWGVESDPTVVGKTVWAELDASRGHSR